MRETVRGLGEKIETLGFLGLQTQGAGREVVVELLHGACADDGAANTSAIDHPAERDLRRRHSNS